MEHQIRPGIVRCRIPVDEDQPVAAVVSDQPRRRIHRQAGAGHDEQIRIRNGRNGAIHGVTIQRLLIKHHIRLDDAAAGAPGHAGCILDKFRAVEFSAAGAVIAQHGAMKLINAFAAGFLMQAVNVLGHHSGEPALFFPPGENFVGDVWLKAKGQHLLPIESEEILRIPLIEAVADDPLRGILKPLIVQPVHAAEVRDAAFRRYPRTAEKDDAVAFGDPLFE